ncbi:hypothetical protein HID58_077897 [Brassica napus]|uniref:Uncharacterized protein n=1 Tax=Brassica napus TaxID=3708 RepID=A0ABQ7YRN2_BRANA|nr:hypothetical protein HID58_077897 [Brassica napus]
MNWFVWIYLVPYEFSVMYCDKMVMALLIAYIKYVESRMCGRGGQIKSWCSCEPTRKTNKGEVGLEVSVTPSDMSLRCNVGKKTHREMLRIKRSVSAEAVHVPNVYRSYIKRWCKKTGVCEVVTWNVQGTELPEECDDESIGEDKVEFVHEMLCLEDLPERESKTVKRLLGALERTKRHKLAQVLCTLSITWHFTGITSLIIMCNLYFWYLNNRKRLIKERLKL